jgi:hypothetical protein
MLGWIVTILAHNFYAPIVYRLGQLVFTQQKADRYRLGVHFFFI